MLCQRAFCLNVYDCDPFHVFYASVAEWRNAPWFILLDTVTLGQHRCMCVCLCERPLALQWISEDEPCWGVLGQSWGTEEILGASVQNAHSLSFWTKIFSGRIQKLWLQRNNWDKDQGLIVFVREYSDDACLFNFIQIYSSPLRGLVQAFFWALEVSLFSV